MKSRLSKRPSALLFEVIGLGTSVRDARLLALEDLVALEVAAIGQHVSFGLAGGLLRALAIARQLAAIVTELVTSWATIMWCLASTAVCTL